jgi:hypothetical protein
LLIFSKNQIFVSLISCIVFLDSIYLISGLIFIISFHLLIWGWFVLVFLRIGGTSLGYL